MKNREFSNELRAKQELVSELLRPLPAEVLEERARLERLRNERELIRQGRHPMWDFVAPKAPCVCRSAESQNQPESYKPEDSLAVWAEAMDDLLREEEMHIIEESRREARLARERQEQEWKEQAERWRTSMEKFQVTPGKTWW